MDRSERTTCPLLLHYTIGAYKCIPQDDASQSLGEILDMRGVGEELKSNIVRKLLRIVPTDTELGFATYRAARALRPLITGFSARELQEALDHVIVDLQTRAQTPMIAPTSSDLAITNVPPPNAGPRIDIDADDASGDEISRLRRICNLGGFTLQFHAHCPNFLGHIEMRASKGNLDPSEIQEAVLHYIRREKSEEIDKALEEFRMKELSAMAHTLQQELNDIIHRAQLLQQISQDLERVEVTGQLLWNNASVCPICIADFEPGQMAILVALQTSIP